MSYWLRVQEIYNILRREMPSNVFADSVSPSAYFISSDLYSSASGLENVYTNLSLIYQNIFPQTSVEDISNWEATVFPRAVPTLPTLYARQQRVIEKLRFRRSISLWDVLQFIFTYVPIGTYVQLIEYTLPRYGWRLGQSTLGFSTFLGNDDQYHTQYNAGAYTYGIRIYDFTLDAITLPSFLNELSYVEPTRCVHDLQMGLSLAGSPYQTVIANVNRFSGVPLVAVDPTSLVTGYTGRTT